MWTYDDAGNILSRKEYAYTTGSLGPVLDTVNYTYGDDSWGDLLTTYDGVPITYDAIGNPLNDGTWTYTWRNGRELASMSNGTTTWNYTYDANGMRTSRTNGAKTYNYVYNGSQLTQMTVGNDTLYFVYDATGAPAILVWNGVAYYYITSLQGDVIRILDEDGEIVVSYEYDAWGNVIQVGGPMANTLGALNPLRYRGYVYDEETELYYLQSRYYNPEIGRFVNADALVSTGQGLLGNNMFAYCLNNPVNRIDVTGAVSLWYYLIIDSDMGFIHRAVQSHIRENYAVRIEVPLTSCGRADILQSGAVWEIKHAGASPATRALLAYTQATSYVSLNEEVTQLGNAGAFAGEFYIGCLDSSYKVEYTTPYAGVVLYTVSEIDNYTGNYSFVYNPVKLKDEVRQINKSYAKTGGGAVCCMALLAGSAMLRARDFSYCTPGS